MCYRFFFAFGHEHVSDGGDSDVFAGLKGYEHYVNDPFIEPWSELKENP